jgi:hypothetical protein
VEWATFAVRIGVGQRPFQSLAAKDDDETMFLAGLDDDFRVADFFIFAESNAHSSSQTSVAMRPARRSVTIPFASSVQNSRARDVARLQLNAQAERLDDAATDLKFQRVIAEQTEMARPAAGRDAGRDGNHAALRGIFRDLVEVGRRRGFERREIILLLRRDVAEAVEHDEHELGFGLESQFGIKRVQIHADNLLPNPPRAQCDSILRRDKIADIILSRMNPLMLHEFHHGLNAQFRRIERRGNRE